MKIIAKEIWVKGLVQGVGFRPFIYRLANEYQLFGTVENNNLGVRIILEGSAKKIQSFIDDLPLKIPEASHINEINIKNTSEQGFKTFEIIKSRSISDQVTEVSPDIAICKNCLDDMKHQPNRIDYAFTNCTNCGPRFTIIKDLPYDRPKTSMAEFIMCDDCKKEYTTILDRRFHAQPVACKNCGPHYSFYYNRENKTDEINEIISIANKEIMAGKILAIKGMGGYHLACDAFNNETVKELRRRKNREGKPLAIMFANISFVKKYLHLSIEEEKLLTSWRRPIVLLKCKKTISEQLGLGLDTIGVMLPYMPFHYLLFDKLETSALVLTSGNTSDEPIVIDNQAAFDNLSSIADSFITYNRGIHNRTDDSVCFVSNKKTRIIRRSRSYAPSPIKLNLNTEGIFAAGAELVNCFAIGKGEQIIMSQHIGDLKNLETLEFYKEAIERFTKLFRFKPEFIVADMHPEYLSSKFAREMSGKIIEVQHHHAHIASCMAENFLDEKVIGISFDGTGYGTDGNIWGGEFFICDLNNFERYSHFEYIPQPGGDASNHHPWRMLLSYLKKYFGDEFIIDNLNLFNGINQNEINLISSMIDKNLNCPLSCSAGRLFDAVSALLGICRNSTYHAEAPMRLEAACNKAEYKIYNIEIKDVISFKQCFKEMINDIKSGVDISIIANSFHYSLVNLVLKVAEKIRKNKGINKVVLSGGSFQNRILLSQCEKVLQENNFDVFTQSEIPSNDGGIALGQLAIAAKRRSLGIYN